MGHQYKPQCSIIVFVINIKKIPDIINAFRTVQHNFINHFVDYSTPYAFVHNNMMHLTDTHPENDLALVK